MVIFIIAVVLNSCEDKRFQTYMANVPIYLSYEDLRQDIIIQEGKAIVHPGKIYFKDDFIFINEYMEGVHVIDISDPSSPDPVAYIPVPGNIDMAIKDNILYLDSYTDLILVDVSDPANPFEKQRIEDVLEYTLPEYDYNYPLAEIDEDKGVVMAFEVKKYTQEIYNNPYPYPVYWSYAEMDMLNSSRPMGGGGGSAGSVYGIAGSMARFLTYDNYLYMLQSDNKLKIVDISNPDNPTVEYEKYAGWGLETMFIYDKHLYLGSTDGLYIFDINSPKNPVLASVYQHITSCDPVVVSGNYAYVTLRSGNRCGGDSNLLEVIDISDKYAPKRVASYGMDEPYGLGISGNTLFVCQGEYGLSVYDAYSLNITNHKLAEFSSITAKDVIPVDDLLFLIGDDGLYIYDYSDIYNIFQVGSVLIEGE